MSPWGNVSETESHKAEKGKSFFVTGHGGLCFGTQSIRGIMWAPGCVNSIYSCGGPGGAQQKGDL